MPAQFTKHFVQDLTQDIKIRQCGTIAFNKDNESNVISVDLYNGQEEYSGGGSVTGACICPDGSTVPLIGSISGKTASVTLTGDCFAFPGQIGIGIQLVSGTVKTTVLKAIYNVELFETDDMVDPGSRITASVGQLVADIEAATADIPASDMASLMSGIAPTFSTSTNYATGAYVYYSGTLYRFTADHAAGSWTGTDATAVALSNSLGRQVDILTSAQIADYYALNSGRLLIPSPFERGNIANNGNPSSSLSRIRTTYTFTFDEEITYTIDSGFIAKPVRWNRTTGELAASNVWYNDAVTFTTEYIYKLVVMRTPEDTSEIVNVAELASAIHRSNSDITLSKETMPANSKAVGDGLTALSGDISTINGEVSALGDQVSTLNGNVTALGSKLDSVAYDYPYGIQPYQMAIFKPVTNLFAGAFTYYRYHRYYDNGTNGKLLIKATQSYNGWLIRVKSSTTYTFGPVDYRVKQFNANLDMIKSITDVSNSEPNTITTEANAYWMSITQLDSRDMSEWMMVEGDTYPAEYVSGYPQWVNTPKSAGVGKKIAFFGDSITAGSGVTGQPDSQIYHQYLHDIYGFTCLNYAYGSSGYVTTYESQGNTPGAIENDSSLKGLHGKGLPGRGYANKYYHFWPNNVLSMMQRMSDTNSIDDLEKITDPTTLDGVVIFAGTNDWSHEVSLVNFGNGVDAVLDYYQNNFGSVPLLVLTPIHRIRDTISGAAHLSEYADIIIQKCREHGIPYIDTFSMSGLQPNNAGNSAVFFPRDDNEQHTVDGVHPNHLAHQRIERAIGETLNQLMLWKEKDIR